MAAYCKCKICKISPAQPAKGSANANPEIVSGRLFQLGPEDFLVHWSSRRYARMMSTELANIEHRGVNPKAVCASFYLYRGGTAMPKKRPPQLEFLGLGGNERYVVRSDVTQKASIYLKSTDEKLSSPEVVVVLGCGGYIEFNGENATGITRLEAGFVG